MGLLMAKAMHSPPRELVREIQESQAMLIGTGRKLGDQRLVDQAYKLARALDPQASHIVDPAALRGIKDYY